MFSIQIKRNIIKGTLALIPIGLTILTIKIIYIYIDRRVVGLVDDYTGIAFPGFGLILFVLFLYLVGLLANHLLGQRLILMIDTLASKIPIINTTYKVGQQLKSTFSLPENEIFRRAVFVEYLTPGMWTLGFVTGSLSIEGSDEKLLKVFIPTPPNPVSGTMVIMQESKVHDPGWSVDDALETVISGGLIGPDKIPFSLS